MSKAKDTEQRLSLRIKLLYSTGDLSTSIPLAIIMFFQLYFLTDVAGMRPDLAGWAVAIGRVWDSINDPLFGLLSDRIRSRHGRRRVVLLYGAVPLGLAFALMWLVPPLGEIGQVAYYALTFILFDTMFTLIHVSYNSLTPEITQDYDERSSLNGFRMVYSIGGTLLAIILMTVLGWYVSNPRTLYFWAGIGLGLVSIIPPWIVFAVTRERKIHEEYEILSYREAIRTTLSNRPFWMVMGLYLFSWTAASVLAAILIYFANYYLKVPEQANYFVLVAQASAILFIPLWVWAARRLDKKRAFIYGTASWIVVLLVLAVVQPNQIGLTYALAFLSGSGIAVAYVLPWSMIPDIIEMDELECGQRREGSFYAFASFFQKLGTGFAIWLMGQALAWTGYITPNQAVPLPAQPPGAINTIRLFISVLPAVLLVISILFAWRYPISREAHRDMLAQLAERE
jgi:GPH family glycoside/pentoside/hexuronide:cation symporter